MEILQQTAAGLREAIAGGDLTAERATELYLERIDRLDGALGAFTQVFHERALQRARAVDAGEVTGPLAGLPVAVKDNLCTRYGRTTCASRMLAGFRSPYTATAVERLERAGAVVLGKTNLDEFAMGSSTEHSSLATTRNPWARQRVPGGSSGGSAVAVAAGLCAAALGSDTGGSVRQPAALCGVVGLKPTYGLVSRYGLVAFASSLDQIGPVTRTVEDAALLLEAIAGHDTQDATSAPPEVSGPVDAYRRELQRPVEGLRIGVAGQYLSEGNHPAVVEAVDRAMGQYRQMGAQVVGVDLPHTEYGVPAYYLVATAEASSNLARYDGVRYGHRSDRAGDLETLYAASRSEGFGEEVQRRIMLGTYALSSGYYDQYYLRALKVRRLIREDFDQAFGACDVLLCPTTPGPAFPLGSRRDDPVAMYVSDVYTVNANLAGIAAISVPGGFAEEQGVRLPVGLQLLGPAWSEARLLRIARMYERANRWSASRPDL